MKSIICEDIKLHPAYAQFSIQYLRIDLQYGSEESNFGFPTIISKARARVTATLSLFGEAMKPSAYLTSSSIKSLHDLTVDRIITFLSWP